MKKIIFTAALCALLAPASAQSITQKHARFLTKPTNYVAQRTTAPLKIDGVLDEKDWNNAATITEFVDISGEGFPTPRFATEAKMMWDDDYLYVGAFLHEPDVWADLTKRDEIVYNNPDFEVFIDPEGDGQNYFEIETNAIATIFDLFVQKPYRARSRAFVTFAYDTPGLKLDTHVYGTLNDNTDTDRGWSVEMAIPRTALAAEFDNNLKAGNYLRLGFSRVEWQTEKGENGKSVRKKDANGKLLPEDNWTWGPTGMIAMHMPERWGYVYLSDTKVGTAAPAFEYPADMSCEQLLWAMFYEQNEAKDKTGKYIARLKDFRLTKDELAMLPAGATITVEATTNKFEITIHKADGKTISIDEDGKLSK